MKGKIVVYGAVPTYFALVGIAGCTDSGPGSDGARERLQLAPTGAVLSGAVSAVIATLEDPSGFPLRDREVTFSASPGAVVTPRTGRTDSEGRLEVQWQTLDRDTSQTLIARTERTADTLSIITTPNVSALEITPLDTTVDLGAVISLRTVGLTPTGRRVVLGAAAPIGVVSELPDSPLLPVTALPSAIGPGVAYVRAQFGGLQSAIATVRVRQSQPIVGAPTNGNDAKPGGTLTLEGLGLDQLDRDAIMVDGREAPIVEATATTVTVRLPQDPPCSGRARWPIVVRGAFTPAPVAIVVRRTGELQLGIGETVSLQAVSDSVCLQFPSTASEYAVVMTDTRSVNASARDVSLIRSQRFDVSVSDRTGPPRTASLGYTATRLPFAESGDAVMWSRGASSATNIPADWTSYRTVPYRVGDRFSARIDGAYLGGSIFRVSTHLAVGILDRDADLNLPARLRDLDAAMQFVETHGVPVLRDVFGPEWPATSEGSGQTMVLITRIGAIGLTAVGQRELINGQWQQGVLIGLKGDSPGNVVSISGRVLTHELAHAAQDRHTLMRCRDLGECQTRWFDEIWATEGGAELVAEEAQRREAGLSRRGNHPLRTLQLLNYYNFRGFFGTLSAPHWDWGWGYASSTPVLNDLVERVVDRGATTNQALREVVLGSFEGWFGLRGTPGIRPGLQERLRPWLGAEWRPEDAVRRALQSLALDDRIPSREFTAPFLQNAGTHFSPALDSESGRGESSTVRVGGDAWAHYTLRDDGSGGSWLLTTTASDIRWSVTRIR